MRRERNAEVVLATGRRAAAARASRRARTGACGTAAPLTQREVLRDVMLSAAECATWLTLCELSQLTKYAEASISAQLRHLRKREFGGYFLEKRLRRGAQMALREHGPVWEYRLRRGSADARHALAARPTGRERCDSAHVAPR